MFRCSDVITLKLFGLAPNFDMCTAASLCIFGLMCCRGHWVCQVRITVLKPNSNTLKTHINTELFNATFTVTVNTVIINFMVCWKHWNMMCTWTNANVYLTYNQELYNEVHFRAHKLHGMNSVILHSENQSGLTPNWEIVQKAQKWTTNHKL